MRTSRKAKQGEDASRGSTRPGSVHAVASRNTRRPEPKLRRSHLRRAEKVASTREARLPRWLHPLQGLWPARKHGDSGGDPFLARAAAEPSNEEAHAKEVLPGPAWWRSSKATFASTVLLGLAAVVVGAWLTQRAIQSELFRVDDIAVEGCHQAACEAVIQAAGLRRGANIFSIQSERARRLLLRDPWVRNAVVTRRLPRRVEVKVTEWQPLAVLRLGEQNKQRDYLIARDGVVFMRRDDTQAHPFSSSIPVVTSADEGRLWSSRLQRREAIAQAMEVMRAFERSMSEGGHAAGVAMLTGSGSGGGNAGGHGGRGVVDRDQAGKQRARILEVHLESPDQVILTLGPQPVVVHLSTTHQALRFQQLWRVLRILKDRNEAARVVHLDDKRRVSRVTVQLRPS